jgi:5-methylcytosine-specific restriction enzyme B
MSFTDRQQQFETAIRQRPGIKTDARIAKNFGFSNSARVLEGGLFACTNNLQTYSAGIANGTTPATTQFVFLCVLTFPPQDEVYFAIVVGDEAPTVNSGLIKLYREGEEKNKKRVAEGQKAGSISNNVKFYITSDGGLFFHNEDFYDSLTGVALDPDCIARIDSVIFSIWPADVTARRSLLAREFVGYLGSLVGSERVHELITWTSATAVAPSMRRMPQNVPLKEIEDGVNKLGGHYPHGEIARLHAALNFHPTKHFVILSGLSGTGKTQLALKYAGAVHGLTSAGTADPLLFVCPVRPEWTDPTGLTGYYDVLTNRYVVPTFLEAVLVATAHRESPVFVVLDELNLARVEYYFSDVLSSIETGQALQLHSNVVPLEGTTGTSIRAALPLPPNLFIIGTINIDETTNAVSDKVLDRASVIDMSKVDIKGFLAKLASGEPTLSKSCDEGGAKLLSVHDLLLKHGLGFGYRVAEEFVRYHNFAVNNIGMPSDAVVDDLMVQKVLVKLRGTEKQRPLLTALEKELTACANAKDLIGRLLNELDDFGSFQATR